MPPAEQWLGVLRSEPGLWKNFVPVAFHVNYWDHLGWRDALASSAFSDRERAYAASWGSSSVSTPCFVRNGAEWRPRGRTVEPGRELAAEADAGTLTLNWPADAPCAIDYVPAASANQRAVRWDVHIALLGSGLVSKVRAGENAGRELHHEFAALRLETVELKRRASGTYSATVVLPPRPDLALTRRAVAALISNHGTVVPLQAVGGWVD